MLFYLCVLSFDGLFLTVILYRAQCSHSGISDFFGALLPTAVITFISFGGNKLIGTVKPDEGNSKQQSTPGDGNGEKKSIPHDGNDEKESTPGESNGEEKCNSNNEDPTTAIVSSNPKHQAHFLCNETSKRTKNQFLRKTSCECF